jgi:hypothetical protein
MSARIVFAALVSAALLSFYSSAIAADIRPEVAQPLDEARVLANGWSDKAVVLAKLNQAASVPDLNRDERHQIVIIRDYALARAGNGSRIDPGASSAAQTRDTLPQSSLNSVWPYR